MPIVSLFGPRNTRQYLEEKQEVLGQGEGGGRRHGENGDTADMINEFTEIRGAN